MDLASKADMLTQGGRSGTIQSEDDAGAVLQRQPHKACGGKPAWWRRHIAVYRASSPSV